MTQQGCPGWEITVPGPAAELRASRVTGAVITPYVPRQVDTRRRAIRSAVYAEGTLVRGSVRQGGIGGDLVTSDDPEQLNGVSGFDPAAAEHVEGRWLYGGPFMAQFGHFLTESLPTLWPDFDGDGILFTPFVFGSEVAPWHRTLIERALPGKKVHVVGNGARVDDLIIPDRPVVLNDSVATAALSVWRKVADRPHPSRNVFLSRSHLPRNSRWIEDDGLMDDIAEDLGFEVVHPEELSIEKQLEIAARARILAGPAGSALHLSVFAPPSARVIEIGDRRTPDRPLPMQRIIDGAFNRRVAFLPHDGGARRDVGYFTKSLGSLLEDAALANNLARAKAREAVNARAVADS